MASKQMSKPEYYRSYAAELRAIADVLRRESTRRTLQRVADDFERMADADDDPRATLLKPSAIPA